MKKRTSCLPVALLLASGAVSGVCALLFGGWLSYFSRLFDALAAALAVGLAIDSMRDGHAVRAYARLLWIAAANAVKALVPVVCTVFLSSPGDAAALAGTLALSYVANLPFLLVDLLFLGVCHLVFFRRLPSPDESPVFSVGSGAGCTALAFVGLTFLVDVVRKALEIVSFVRTYAPLYTDEITSMCVDAAVTLGEVAVSIVALWLLLRKKR